MKVLTGLDVLASNTELQKKLSGGIGYLCHQASVDGNWNHGAHLLKALFGRRFKAMFGPQHGVIGDLQDNMRESPHSHHSYFDLPVYSLYSETRVPSEQMLEGIQHLIVDLQDVGARVYTFISTMTLAMEACSQLGIEVVILDRPNPIGNATQGNILDGEFSSFVGRHPLPTRHGMTMGEMAHWAKRYQGIHCPLRVVAMQGYSPTGDFGQTGLPWVPPSPNIPTVDSCLPFVGTVLFEGTSVSEGRGTTRPLEIIGHPALDPWKHLEGIVQLTQDLEGFVLRPCHFRPTFQKHAGTTCGGYQIHVTHSDRFSPWRVAQYLCQYFYHNLEGFRWKDPPYEYEHEILPIDLINGSDRPRHWVEKSQGAEELAAIEKQGQGEYLESKQSVEMY